MNAWMQQILLKNLPVLRVEATQVVLILPLQIVQFSKYKGNIRKGWLDFHKIAVSVLKHTFHRSAPKALVYRDYKNFYRVIITRELKHKLNQQINEYLNISDKYF